ncbi:MAG: glutamate synthase subunit alpha, partial [Opitutae bacterium]|nr:glutamate synthase subunit alpha [Opitutae bacterium]
VHRPEGCVQGLAFERKLYLARRMISFRLRYDCESKDADFHASSFSSRTMVYKGMLTTEQLGEYFPDLQDSDMESALALTHSRFSTNTFPSWPRAQPFRYLCHNGEINTVRGNENWLYARQMQLASEVFGDDVEKLFPIIRADGSDSQKFDNCLEFLVLSGRSLAHAMMMMIPEPWEKHQSMSKSKQEFYKFHACLMEPWDGPASIAFSDGVQIGAVLDRNGLRPSRYYVTSNDRVILASEVGVLSNIPSSTVIKKGRLEPGRMFMIDMEEGKIVDDEELKERVSSEQNYSDWLSQSLLESDQIEEAKPRFSDDFSTIMTRQKAFGFTFEDLRFLIGPSAQSGKQPLGSMGNDSPLAVLSDKSQLIYNYFKQLFAQVTNPPIDPIREEIVTASITFVGSEGNLTKPGPESCRMIKYESPIVDDSEISKLQSELPSGFKSSTIDTVFDPTSDIDGKNLSTALESIFQQADQEIKNGSNILILSDRSVTNKQAAIPALLACSGLHHHLIRSGTRTKVSIVVESGEPREVQHFALLLGYGADLINPYLSLETIRYMISEGNLDLPADVACKNFLKANLSGVIKTMSKMGISTVASYRGAQIFE